MEQPLNVKTPACGLSELNAGLCLSAIQKFRDETAARCCVDIALSDGTVMYAKEQGIAQVALYDELLDALKHQAGVAGVDPICPSSCCAPRSCDPLAP